MMNLHTLVDNLEALVRSGAPQAQILSMLEDLRLRAFVLERLDDSPLPFAPHEAVPDANVAPDAAWPLVSDCSEGEIPPPETPAPDGPTAGDGGN
jgi:hypothetical protein